MLLKSLQRPDGISAASTNLHPQGSANGGLPWACSMDSSLREELDQVKPMHILTDNQLLRFPMQKEKCTSSPPYPKASFHV